MRRKIGPLMICVTAYAVAATFMHVQPAAADPNSPFFSEKTFDDSVRNSRGPWENSQVKVPDYIAVGSSASSLGAPMTGLDAVSAGRGGAFAGIGAGIGAANAALSVTVGTIGPQGGAGAAGGGAAGAQQGALSGLGALGFSHR